MKKIPILCGTCHKYRIKRDHEGKITGYVCFGSSMQRAHREKSCVSYSRDDLQESLVPSDSELLGW